jgi:hypothetical protein
MGSSTCLSFQEGLGGIVHILGPGEGLDLETDTRWPALASDQSILS